ncbi:unnamed protein product [Ectocarpus sp. 4 AP-2014]
MGKASRRQDGHQAEKAPCKPSNAEWGEKEPRKGSWVPSITWLFVLAVALIYRFVDERQISKRELPLPSDLFIVSYPKSGNFWVRFLLAHTWLYSQPGESNWHREIDFNSIERTIPDLEYGPNRRDYHLHDKFRAFKSHQPFAPKAVAGKCADTVGTMDDHQCACPNCPPKWRRILHLVRDGRDVMCSYYHFRMGLNNLDPPDMGFEEFLKAHTYPGFTWAEHVNSYLDLKGNSSYDVLTVKYEDLHRAPLETLLELSKWAGLDHSEKVLQRAIVRSSFKSMRRKEEARGLLIFDEKYPDRDKSWRMTRKGKAGGWEECFASPASKDIFNELAYDTLFGLGYVQDERW